MDITCTWAAGLFLYTGFAPEHRRRHRMVQLCAFVGAGLLTGKASRYLGADDHVHGDLRPSSRRFEIIVTAFKMRAPGMTLNRVPLFVWSMVVTSFMVIFAMPSVMMGSMFLRIGTADRHAFLQLC